jgi:uncharacterized membrane protein
MDATTDSNVKEKLQKKYKFIVYTLYFCKHFNGFRACLYGSPAGLLSKTAR